MDISPNGTPGADVCEVAVVCPMNIPNIIESTHLRGESEECNGTNNDHCLCTEEIDDICTSGVNRSNESLAYDGNDQCGDNYMSLGINGQLVLGYDTDLIGCTIRVVELAGNDREGYSVNVCTDSTLEECMNAQEGMTGSSFGEGGIGTSFTFRLPE